MNSDWTCPMLPDDEKMVDEVEEEPDQMPANIPTAEKLVSLIGVLRLNGVVTQGLKLEVYSRGTRASIELDLTKDIDKIVDEVQNCIQISRDFGTIEQQAQRMAQTQMSQMSQFQMPQSQMIGMPNQHMQNMFGNSVPPALYPYHQGPRRTQ